MITSQIPESYNWIVVSFFVKVKVFWDVIIDGFGEEDRR